MGILKEVCFSLVWFSLFVLVCIHCFLFLFTHKIFTSTYTICVNTEHLAWYLCGSFHLEIQHALFVFYSQILDPHITHLALNLGI